METKIKQVHYGTIDGVRAFSALAIILMHVLANGGYEIKGFVFERVIPSFTELVYLFMIISAFGMCCGYYDKILSRQISVEKFYGKRFIKIWPFFAFLSMVDVVLSPSSEAVYESFANLTLCFGLLPNANITVIGVGWFIGVVFVFYFLFPFFCYLLSDKRRAWLSFGVAFIYNFLCRLYFFNDEHVSESFIPRTSFIYCAVFFLAGGLVYLYREQLGKFSEKYQGLILVLCAGFIGGYYIISSNVAMMVVIFSLVLICTLGMKHKKLLENPVSHFLSSISMEIYLCHMVIFRIVERLHISHLFRSDLLSYILTALVTIGGAIGLAVTFDFIMKKIIAAVNGRKIISTD